MISLKERNFAPEFNFSTSRSSGPGGQNVNKVNTKVELRFSITSSELLSEYEKSKILTHLKNRINSEGDLLIVAQNERTQLKNKQEAIRRFKQLIFTALKPIKKRRPTRPTKASVERRLQYKKEKSQRKTSRVNNFE
jgi:ribosome-associated protein